MLRLLPRNLVLRENFARSRINKFLRFKKILETRLCVARLEQSYRSCPTLPASHTPPCPDFTHGLSPSTPRLAIVNDGDSRKLKACSRTDCVENAVTACVGIVIRGEFEQIHTRGRGRQSQVGLLSRVRSLQTRWSQDRIMTSGRIQ